MSTTDTTTAKPTYAEGSWKATLDKSATLFARSGKARAQASALLWTGAQAATAEWLENSDTDVHAENLNADLLDVLGKERKGDVSKIRTVALAVRSNGLVMESFDNLSKAYNEAIRLTKTAAAQRSEDDAIEEAVENITAPKSTSSVDGAAALLLSKGVDGAVVAILDALGGTNFEAHRGFMRAVSTEISSRVQAAKPKPVKKAPAAKKTATPAKKATVASGKAKPKSAAKKSAATKATEAVPTLRSGRAKPKPGQVAPVEEQTDETVTEENVPVEDMFDALAEGTEEVEPETEPDEQEPTPAAKKAVARPKGKPVRR